MKKLEHLFGDTSGQFAIITALMAVPLLICTGVAIDTAMLNKQSNSLQSALDSAALAAVVPGNYTNEAREQYAAEVFEQNYPGAKKVDLKINATAERVDMQGVLTKETLFMGIIGKNKISQRNETAAIKTVEDVICVMTLNKTNRGSLTIEKDALLNAPDCSVQVNSSNKQALVSSGNFKPLAKKICVTGGVTGNFAPNLQANCSYIEDPYANLKAPDLNGYNECDYGPMNLLKLALLFDPDAIIKEVGDTINVGERGGTLSPGIYCHGLHIYDSEVTLEPGTYIIHEGPLTIGNGSVVKGEDVTFVFTGEDSFLYTYDEVSIDLTAAKDGPYAGLIFFQDRNASKNESSIIKGSADIRLVGTVYFPTQDLFVGGLGVMGANSPAMAFIADNMTFTSDIDQIISAGESNVQFFKSILELIVGNSAQNRYALPPSSGTGGASPGTKAKDFTTSILTSLGSHSEAGLPPILPRSDGGARLVSADESRLQ